MLLSFGVKNYKSIKGLQTLYMTPTKIKDTDDALTFNNGQYDKSFATGVMYGPNSSGKTTLIRAISTMKRVILQSLFDQDILSKRIVPFAFSNETVNEPTEFNISFISNNIKYNYGFSATKYRIEEEWLFHYPKGRANKLFERYFDHESNKYIYEMGQEFKGERKGTQNITDQNSLFLSATQRTSAKETTLNVLNWFKESLVIIGVDGVDDIYTSSLIDDNDINASAVCEFLRSMEIDVSDLQIKQIPFNENILPNDMPQSLKEDLINKLKDKISLETEFIHTVNGKNYYLPLEEESSGTKRLYGYAAPILDALLTQKVLLIDELDSNLHSNVIKSLVNTFMDISINKFRSQLFFTTHDTSLLSIGTLRRDQIWLSEKNSELATEISCIAEYKIRAMSNYEDAYLSGKFRAIPPVTKIYITNEIKPTKKDVTMGSNNDK
jgi:AAA15 family ATPase/GTPase